MPELVDDTEAAEKEEQKDTDTEDSDVDKVQEEDSDEMNEVDEIDSDEDSDQDINPKWMKKMIEEQSKMIRMMLKTMMNCTEQVVKMAKELRLLHETQRY